jgi:uncharacterized membrane protein
MTWQTLNRRNLLSGLLFGIGAIAFLDETLFHQLLHWHHFYDKSTTSAGLVSDGLFHAASWFATIAALFLLADLRRNRAWNRRRWIGSALLGAGAFQLYDGIVQHKLMRLHQIRYHVDIVPYDAGWSILAALMMVGGIVLIWRTSTAVEPLAEP